MKNIVFLFFLGFYFSINTFAQSKFLVKDGNHFLFTYKKSTYLIVDDSIFNISKDQVGFPKLHCLAMKEFKFIETATDGYMKNASSGIVYKFDGQAFYRLDNSFDFKSQFRSFTFFHEGQLIDFGGYGLHSFKNSLTYFNFAKKETELFNQVTPLSDTPTARDRMIAQYSSKTLFIGQGHGILNTVHEPFQNAGFITDYWKFSFQDRTWTKLGERLINVTYPYDVLYNFNNHALLISENGVYECDIEKNILIDYPDANFGIIKSLNKNKTLSSIAYNSERDGFYMIIDKSLQSKEVLFVKRDDFLGKQKINSELYSNFSYLSLTSIIAILFLFLGAVALFFTLRKKSVAYKIKSNEKEIKSVLKHEDATVLFNLVAAYPEFINYSSLLDLFPDHLSYESKKKKIRQSILSIEDYLTRKYKLSSPVFVFRKNIEDKREKQIRIK